MKFRILIIVYLLIRSLSGYCQQPIDKYNFDFEDPISESSWICIRDDFKVKTDSVNKIKGKKSLLLSRTYLHTESNLNLNQTILLPKTVKTITASIYAMNDQLFEADLKLTGLDKNRNLVASDSISIIGKKGWQNFMARINSKNGIDILLIEIRAKEPFKEKKEKVMLWIDNLHITLNGVDLYAYKDPKYQYSQAECNDISKNVKITSLLEIPQKNIENINSRIIGFGETVHRSKEIPQSVFNNIKQLITKHNCRLVLLEVTIDLGIRLNQYIHEERFEEDLSDLVAGNLLDNEELCSFLNWVKQYNSSNKDKVTIAGLDYLPDSSPRLINNFLLSKNLNSTAVDTLLKMINTAHYRSIPLKFAENHASSFKPIIGERDYYSLIQYLKNRTDTLCRLFPLFKSYDWSGMNRDYLLWQNAKFAIENLVDRKSKIAIYTHLAHQNKNVPIFINSIKSLGQHLYDCYGSNYYVVGMLVGEGTLSTNNSVYKISSQKIQFPALRSIEYICSLAKTVNFYKTLPLLSTYPVLYRNSGGVYSKEREFDPSFTNGSMDAIVYINNITEAKLFPVLKWNDPKIFDLYKKIKH